MHIWCKRASAAKTCGNSHTSVKSLCLAPTSTVGLWPRLLCPADQRQVLVPCTARATAPFDLFACQPRLCVYVCRRLLLLSLSPGPSAITRCCFPHLSSSSGMRPSRRPSGSAAELGLRLPHARSQTESHSPQKDGFARPGHSDPGPADRRLTGRRRGHGLPWTG